MSVHPPDALALHVTSDLLIALACFVIPILLWQTLRVQPNLSSMAGSSPRLTLWFMAFIFLCGLTHVMDVVTIWAPHSSLFGLVKLTTALVSVGTTAALFRGLLRWLDQMDTQAQTARFQRIYTNLQVLRRKGT